MAWPFPPARPSYKLNWNVDKYQEFNPGLLLQGYITCNDSCQDEEVNPKIKYLQNTLSSFHGKILI